MPNYDRRGPDGNGPGTGRGLGSCRTGNQWTDESGGWGSRMVSRLQQRCRRFVNSARPMSRFGGGSTGAGRRGRFNGGGMSSDRFGGSGGGRMRGGRGNRR